MTDPAPLAHVHRQIESAKSSLRAIEPQRIDWFTRSIFAAEELVPWLQETAHDHREFVERVLNSPADLRHLWQRIRPSISCGEEDRDRFDELLAADDVLRKVISGETVSSVLTHSLMRLAAEKFGTNGRSDYPDLFLKNHDYTELPKFTRGTTTYGAALKGKAGRPVRIPDGLEIKTCGKSVRVDCHYPHPGLHLILLHVRRSGRSVVQDLLVGFLSRDDYREAKRNTDATTVKFSFGGGAVRIAAVGRVSSIQ